MSISAVTSQIFAATQQAKKATPAPAGVFDVPANPATTPNPAGGHHGHAHPLLADGATAAPLGGGLSQQLAQALQAYGGK